MFGIGLPELFIICVIALILFGSRLPKIATGLGKAIKNFKAAMSEISEVEENPKEKGETE